MIKKTVICGIILGSLLLAGCGNVTRSTGNIAPSDTENQLPMITEMDPLSQAITQIGKTPTNPDIKQAPTWVDNGYNLSYYATTTMSLVTIQKTDCIADKQYGRGTGTESIQFVNFKDPAKLDIIYYISSKNISTTVPNINDVIGNNYKYAWAIDAYSLYTGKVVNGIFSDTFTEMVSQNATLKNLLANARKSVVATIDELHGPWGTSIPSGILYFGGQINTISDNGFSLPSIPENLYSQIASANNQFYVYPGLPYYASYSLDTNTDYGLLGMHSFDPNLNGHYGIKLMLLTNDPWNTTIWNKSQGYFLDLQTGTLKRVPKIGQLVTIQPTNKTAYLKNLTEMKAILDYMYGTRNGGRSPVYYGGPRVKNTLDYINYLITKFN